MLSRLNTTVQRLIFVIGACAMAPWLLWRAIPGLWNAHGFDGYFDYALARAVRPWFESGWWWYTQLEWYDWTFVPGICFIALAFAWPHGPAKVVTWIRGPR
jgi:hypothetical protein